MDGLFKFFAHPFVQSLLWAIALAFATHVISSIAARALQHFLNRDDNPLPSSSIITINIARGVIWATGASIILDACFGVNANALVAALGVGGIAVSLGFQDTLSNLIGGLQMTFMGIVKPGDNIEVGAEAGVVQDVNLAPHDHPRRHRADGHHPRFDHLQDGPGAPAAESRERPLAVPRLREDGSARASDMDGLADELTQLARTAGPPSPPSSMALACSSCESSELGIKGKIILQVEDAAKTSAAADAIVRAIAALV